MAAVGSAVGLGNIWGFPYKMGACGGFTFLMIYLILAVCCGFIVMVGELAIGRKTGKGAVAAYKALSKKFSWMGSVSYTHLDVYKRQRPSRPQPFSSAVLTPEMMLLPARLLSTVLPSAVSTSFSIDVYKRQ